MRNGSKTPLGILFGILAAIGLILCIVSDFLWGIGFLHLIFR